MRTERWSFTSWLAGAVALAAGCFEPGAVDDEIARVSPLDLVMDNRVVLTPGHEVKVQVEIRREEPDPTHPVHLTLTGGGGDGVTVTLDKSLTKDDVATLTITASDTATAQEVSYAVDGRLANQHDHEPLVVSVQLPTPDANGTEEYAPGVTGVVKSLTINGQTMTYEVINGVAVLGGDIVLGDAATVEARAQLRSATCNPSFHTDFACAAWTDGVIGYSFADNWGSASENARMRTIIMDAMAEWTRQTGFRFVPRTSGQHLQFRDGDGCSSGVGRVVFTGFDSQSISLDNDGCDDIGRAMHEIGHAIGLYHEQQRNDRDSHVVVDFGRVQDGKLHNFFQVGDFLVDRGPYNYDSIMHYEPWAFARDKDACKTGLVEMPQDLSECTVRPTNPPTASIGQRTHLSEGDIFGVYKLYPPVFEIAGAMSGQTSDRFDLRLVYDRGRPQVDRVEWRSNLVSMPLGTGNAITLLASQVPPGPNVITAHFVVAGQIITSRSILLNFSNDAPVVSLRASNGLTEQHMSQVFSVIATINDTEDGTCEDCTISWNPAPATGPTDARLASFRFATPGPQTIEVTVEDRGGATTTASLTVDIVNTAPTVTILQPTDGITIAGGSYVFLRGRGDDINSGTLSCDLLRWSSSNPADVLSSTTGCAPYVQVAGAGTRTITLVASDGYASSAPATVTVTVSACGIAGCPPTAFFTLSDPSEPTTGAYFIEHEMTIVVRVGDVEENEPITYRLFGRRVGETATFPISSRSLMLLDNHTLAVIADLWTPSSSVGNGWFNCVLQAEYRNYEIVLEATDSSGMTTTYSRVIKLGCDLI